MQIMVLHARAHRGVHKGVCRMCTDVHMEVLIGCM